MSKYVIVITGPTAIGKTSLSIKLASHFKTEILSADSRQFYREMSIGTAKPNPDQLNTIPHHFINHLSIHDNYSAGEFEHDAIALLNKLFSKHDVLILAGGSGLFVKAVLEGFNTFPEVDKDSINKIQRLHDENGITSLQKLLKELDPEYYGKVDLNNPHRLMRALSVCISSGKKFSEFTISSLSKRNFTPIKIGLTLERKILYQRIDERVDEMMKEGLLDEVKNLIAFKNLTALQTVGYNELFDYLEKKISLEEAVIKIKQHTRNFAKRQLTWYRKDESISWFNPADYDNIVAFISKSISQSNPKTEV